MLCSVEVVYERSANISNTRDRDTAPNHTFARIFSSPMIYQNDCIGQQPGTGYTKLQQNQSNSVVMEAIEMTLRDIGDGVRTRRSTVRHRYRRSIYIILVSTKPIQPNSYVRKSVNQMYEKFDANRLNL